jgi:hypothetical protein
MSTSSLITGLGILILLTYGSIKILDFYGISINVYGSYLAFYIFLLLSYYVLPKYYTQIKVS